VNLPGLILLVLPALAYGWLVFTILDSRRFRRWKWLPVIAAPLVVGIVYYLIYGRGWVWLSFYPIVLAFAAGLVAGFVLIPLAYVYVAWKSPEKSNRWRLAQLAKGLGFGRRRRSGRHRVG
jgi:hypothetical protein